MSEQKQRGGRQGGGEAAGKESEVTPPGASVVIHP